MICRQCGTEIADKALICYRCGAATADARLQPVTRARAAAPGWLVRLFLVAVLVGLGIYFAMQSLGPGDDPPPAVWAMLGAAAILLGWRLVRRR